MEERIKYLFRLYLKNACSRKEFEEFLGYVKASANDAQLRALIQQVYEATGNNNDAAQTYVDECGNLVLKEPDVFVRTPTAQTTRSGKKRLAVLGVLVAAGLVVLIWHNNSSSRMQVQQRATTELVKKNTERSEFKYLLLPDSTQVWLNVASTLEFPEKFNSTVREVYLSGEAYFDVKHADKHPFIIHTGKVATTVLGTAFNINAYPGRKNIVIAVSRGKVKVTYGNQELATLVKGQQVKVNSDNDIPVEKKMVNANVAAWQQGNLVFDDERLEDILADLERIYNVQIRVLEKEQKNTVISTAFRRDVGIEQALKILCSLTETSLKQANNQYIIY